MRVRNNLASAYSDDDPARAGEMFREARELARQIGDRGMFNWLAGLVAMTALSEGRGWDDALAVMREALEVATIRGDRMRLRTLIGVLEINRGEHLDDVVAEVEELDDPADPDAQFSIGMTRAHTAYRSGDLARAYREILKVMAMQAQNPEVPLGMATAIAIAMRDVDKMRNVAAKFAELPLSGAWAQAQKLEAVGGLAALEGRRADALAAFRESRDIYGRLSLDYERAMVSVNALLALPDDQEVIGWAGEVRPLLVELRAAPSIVQIDAVLPDAAPTPAAAATAEVPTTG
jgi:hypothetical protein